jgi:hypothetical protein
MKQTKRRRMSLGSHAHERSPAPRSLQVERPDHNARVGIIAVPQLPSTDPRHGKTDPTGHPGVYCVTFVLSVPGKNVFREHVALGETSSEGDSLLLLPPNLVDPIEVRFQAGGMDTGSVVLSSNAHRRLATAVVRVNANSIQAAESIAYDMTASALSYLSYLNNVALDITGYEVLEESTGTLKALFGMVGKVKLFSVHGESSALVLNNNYRRLFAAYREGMNATNVFYQALSFSKVIEGCRRMRDTKNAQARASGTQPFTPPLEMPASLEDLPSQDVLVREFFQPFLGRKLTAVVEHFRPLIRNAVAHLDPAQDVLDIDRYEDVTTCERAVPVLRYMAHQFITAELEHP